MIRNDTSQPYQLKVWLTDSELCGSIRVNSQPCEFYKVYEKEHYMNKELYGKYSRHNVIFRKVYDIHNREIADEYVTENHTLMMYEPFLEDSRNR